MEVPGTEETNNSDAHLTSAAAFVEGGVQEACDDACSICLEAFCENDPSTLTGCKHEFHLQCILEWCQRSSQCPMCWQPISLQDPTGQELLEAVVQERSIRSNPPRNTTIFHHPTLGDFELQHLPMGVNDAELEERIIQHLAAAAAMGRSRHIARREGQRNRSSAQGRQQYLVFSTHPSTPPAPASFSPDQMEEGEPAREPAPSVAVTFPSPPTNIGEELSQMTTPVHSSQSGPVAASVSGSSVSSPNQQGSSMSNRRSPSQSSPSTQDRAGPSDMQSFSDSLKARFNAASTRYKESISKSTKGWKERLFSRNTSMADLGSEVKREVNAGFETVSHMMERLETKDNNRVHDASVSNSLDSPVSGSDNRQISESDGETFLNDHNKPAACATGSSSN